MEVFMTVQHMRPLKGIRTAYITDFCIGIGFIIVIAVLLNTQGETVKSALSAGEYSGNWVVFINIWAPLFTISLLSHVFLRASLGQYFHGQFLQRADGKPAGIITLAAVSVLRQVSGAVMLATDFITRASAEPMRRWRCCSPCLRESFSGLSGLIFRFPTVLPD